jgi:hypothetical protein
MKSIIVKTRDTSTIAVSRYSGQVLPVFPAGKTVRVATGERSIELCVGFSSQYQLCGSKGSFASKALHALLSAAPRVEGYAEVTIQWED